MSSNVLFTKNHQTKNYVVKVHRTIKHEMTVSGALTVLEIVRQCLVLKKLDVVDFSH